MVGKTDTFYDKISNNESINSLLDSLLHNEFIKNNLTDSISIIIKSELIRKSIWLASILAESVDEEHIKKVQTLSSLLLLNYKGDLDIEKAIYVLFSRIGNLVSTKFLSNPNSVNVDIIKSDIGTAVERNIPAEKESDIILDIELVRQRNDNVISVNENNYLTTRFQKHLWTKLQAKDNISISAPTSAGKSFIIKKYIKQRIKEDKLKILYIVPSRALINQVSEEFRIDFELNDNVNIRTAFVENSNLHTLTNKDLFILTPERCLKVLQYRWNNSLKFDIIFVDEIQNAENEGGRGSLFEYVLREIGLLFDDAQIITAGPNILNPDGLHNRLFGLENASIITHLSPVFQIKTKVKVIKNDLLLEVKREGNEVFSFSINTPVDIQKKFNKSIGEGLIDVLTKLGQTGQNIIYSPKTNLAESWALKLSDSFIEYTNDDSIEELIDFLVNEIHPKYYLIDCLRKGVAFHHGGLPDLIRKELERLFLLGKIKYLFCTSTLMEGVNLPANNLFITIPKKLTDNLTSFEFGNLIGRAGRLKDSLYGTIYCVEWKNNDPWVDDYYTRSYSKEVVTVLEKTLTDFPDFVSKLSSQTQVLPYGRDANTIIFLKHKLISSEKEFQEYLTIKRISPESINIMLKLLNIRINKISLSPFVIRLNPSIDPTLQNDLYNQILKTGVENWVVVPNANFNQWISRSRRDKLKNSESSLLWQLVSIMEKLDEIFSIRKEAFIKHNLSYTLAEMCVSGVNWINSKTYKQMILDRIKYRSNPTYHYTKFDSNDRKQVNDLINELVKTNTTIVSYILFKYMKLLNDILIPLMTDEQRENYKFSLAMPTMLELGTTESVIIQLISSGIPRAVAIQIYNIFNINKNHDDQNVFVWLSKQSSLGLQPIYEKYLIDLKIIDSRKIEQ